jgi:putative Mn2+ efflux pump MntP
MRRNTPAVDIRGRRQEPAGSLPLILALLALIVPLGLDTFAVSAALGAAGTTGQDAVRVSLTMAAFEGAMPLLGLAIGAPLGAAIGGPANVAAALVLIAIGLAQLLADEAREEQRLRQLSAARGSAALLLGLAVSIDELAVGFTLGLLGLPVIPVVLAIGLQALVLSQVGLRMGARLSEKRREFAEHLAGIALITVGIVLLIEHLA